MNKSIKKYFNPGQIELLEIAANSETIIGSRRFGKSDGIIAPRLLRNSQHMPQSAGAIVQASFVQALSRTIPAAAASLARLGYREGEHYFIGRKAPARLGFKKPLINPSSYEHVIHWYNGSIQHILSQDVKFSANSLTLDYVLADEARSLNSEKFKNEVVPAVSGYPGAFDQIPWHKGITLVSDMPHNKQGEWLLDRKKLMNTELIEVIKDTKREINYLHTLNSDYARNQIIKQQKELNVLRKFAYLYKEFDSIDNLEILGEDYIRKMKRELTPLVFRLSIANIFMRKIEGGFYANLEPSIHYYTSNNNSHINNMRLSSDAFDFKRLAKRDCSFDADLNKNMPLEIALDYNANINWIVTGQGDLKSLRTLSSFFVKNEKKLRALIEIWCDYYALHSCRQVTYYFDATATQNSYADEDGESFAEIVLYELKRRRWDVTPVYMGSPLSHIKKHQYINDALTGIKYSFPTFNTENNEFLIPALEQTGVKIGEHGFKKNKDGEKRPDSETDPAELRTDGTDAWDTLFIGHNFFKQNSSKNSKFSSGLI